jgi:hypothetical protein
MFHLDVKGYDMDMTWISFMDMQWISRRILEGYHDGFVWISMDIKGYMLDNCCGYATDI